jgi:putative SOS response-associated peptidase YedK
MCDRFTQCYLGAKFTDCTPWPAPPVTSRLITTLRPQTPVDVVTPVRDGTTELVSMRRGLIPYWWRKRLKYLPATFNARVESVADTTMFREAFHWQRCIIPASGYYEWIARPNDKRPYYISAADGGTLSFAGLWDRWRNLETREPVNVMHDHRHERQCPDATASRPDAGDS